MPGVRETGRAAVSRVDDEEFAREIGRVSPEGRPGGARLRSGQIRMILIGLFVVFLLAGAVVAWSVNLYVGGAIAVVGVLALVLNPVVVAAELRAEERARVERSLPHRSDEEASR